MHGGSHARERARNRGRDVTEKPQTAARLRVVRAGNAEPEPRPAELALVGEPGQLDALYRRYASYVASIATRLLGRDGEVDDLVQDVFVEAVRGISKLREPNAVKGWLARVAVRLSVRRLRKRRVLQALHLTLEHADYEQLAGSGATLEQRTLIAKVYRLLDQLPARTRVIWTLRYVLDEPLHSIVELTACSQSTVQRRLRDAEKLLEKELRHE
jgi:RNA polymerase sigma-70 factor (ECF subfamily)